MTATPENPMPSELLPIEHIRDAGDGYPAMRVRSDAEVAASLNDLSVLVQIPKVRELVESTMYPVDETTAHYAANFYGKWYDALEATDG